MEMAGSSNALDGSAPTEGLKFMMASNVNVSSFVSVKLSGHNNYNIWKAQMLCLVKSQALLHFIDATNPFPVDKDVPLNVQYDELVKGWIFGSVNEKVLKDLVDSGTARDVWMKLESRFNTPTTDKKEGDSSNAPDVSASVAFPIREDLKYIQAMTVNVSSFVSVKLSGPRNYHIWKAQIICLMESQELLHFLSEEHHFPEDKGVHMIGQYDKLVKGWIFGSMNETVLKSFAHLSLARDVWKQLELFFNSPISNTIGDSSNEGEDLKYMQASNVSISSFVSVKLFDRNNYKIWKAQMLCLIMSQGLLHIIDARYLFPEDKGFHMIWYYDQLVKGWIFASMNEQLLHYFVNIYPAANLWSRLESQFNSEIIYNTIEPPPVPSSNLLHSEPALFVFGIELSSEVQEIDNTTLKTLCEAAIEGYWWKAKSILKIHKNAATQAVTANGNTILHLAVELGHNYFVEKLLEFLEDGKDTEMKNDKGRTALHIAAMVGNEYAAKLLVQKRKQLLEIIDNEGQSPLDSAYDDMKLNITTYLNNTILPDLSPYTEGYSKSVDTAIAFAILAKQYALAGALLNKFPECTNKNYRVLMAITITFPTDLGFIESFIYPSFNNVFQKTVMRGSLLFHYNILDKCVDDVLQVMKILSDTCCSWLGKISIILLVPATLYPVYELICLLILVLRLPFSMLYFLLWKFLAVTVRPIKNIEKKKKEYKEAKNILSLICNHMGSSNDDYGDAIIEAVRQGTYEVVDEILYTSPATINCEDDEGHNIIQLTIKNRSEKVYNLISHIIEREKSYRTMTDSSKNNLVHLAGILAPSFALDRNTGAALQLQRELIWREEVQKLMSPIKLMEENSNKETPAMMFTREHKDLVKQGENWMKTTAESCSITAALIVTVVFAAAITVPGGSNQQSGIPIFKKEIAFTIFATSNAISLFTGTTALLLFLSILTIRFSEKDFLVSLQRRLIFGLLMLFISTFAMIVAFGAILFLVFCDQRPWMLAPICGFACLPISVIVTIKLPLLLDLIQSTYVPIFGEKSYLESCKIKRRNTIFTE